VCRTRRVKSPLGVCSTYEVTSPSRITSTSAPAPKNIANPSRGAFKKMSVSRINLRAAGESSRSLPR